MREILESKSVKNGSREEIEKLAFSNFIMATHASHFFCFSFYNALDTFIVV